MPMTDLQKIRAMQSLKKDMPVGLMNLFTFLYNDIEKNLNAKVEDLAKDSRKELNELRVQFEKAMKEKNIPDLDKMLEAIRGKDGKDSLIPGPKGDKGDFSQGLPGPKGEQGSPGKDAPKIKPSEVARILLSDPEFIQATEGPKGEPGEAGEPGKSVLLEEVISKISSMKDIFDITHIKGLPKFHGELSRQMKEFARRMQIHGGGLSYSNFNVETPSGVINGTNRSYSVLNKINKVLFFALNGEVIHPIEYSISGKNINFVAAPPASLSGTSFTVVYV